MKTVFCCLLSSDPIEKKLMMMAQGNREIGIHIKVLFSFKYNVELCQFIIIN